MPRRGIDGLSLKSLLRRGGGSTGLNWDIAEILDAAGVGVWSLDGDGKTVSANEAMSRLLGVDHNTLLASSLVDLIGPAVAARYGEMIEAQDDASSEAGCHLDIARPDGALIAVNVKLALLCNEAGHCTGTASLWIKEISQPERSFVPHGAVSSTAGAAGEPPLQYRLLRQVHRAAKIGTWEAGADESLLWSDETLELFGVERADFTGTIEQFYSLVHPDDRERVSRVRDLTDASKVEFKSDYRIVRPDGDERHMHQTALVLRDNDGEPRGMTGVVQDVTDQVKTEAKLRQAQKMETIGQLSGGVAHDFNNILQVIMGASNLLEQGKTYDEELVQSIIQAAKRGGELTHRLLAFARQQPLKTTQFDVAKLVENVVPMLDRLIGPDIRLDVDVPTGLWPVEADPAPLEEALLNLVVNARDAIAGAGRIAISCCNMAYAGDDYVELLVSDTGPGMSEETRAKATDPFFTTKPVGKGSGLGLSMVEGYVRQSGGHLHLDSAPGSGTVARLWMPRASLAPVEITPMLVDPSRGNGQSVLVIDDNADLAALVMKQLTHLNYRATYATDREAAITAMRASAGFDVVLSDVLLADGERGPALVEDLLSEEPGMLPVFMTGFASEEDDCIEMLNADAIVLRKPFRLEDLAKVMQQVLSIKSGRLKFAG